MRYFARSIQSTSSTCCVDRSTWPARCAMPSSRHNAGRSGRMVLPTPPELDVAVYALDPGTELDLEWDAQHGHAVSARWGEPLRLLVEGVARAD